MDKIFMIGCLATALTTVPVFGDDDASAEKASQFKKFAKYIPLNQPIRRVVIPQYKEGVQTVVVKAQVMRRISEVKFSMEMLEVQVFEDGKPSMTVTTPRALYDMDRLILKSDAPTKMVHQGELGWDANGSGMVFDVKRRFGSLLQGTTSEITLPKSRTLKRTQVNDSTAKPVRKP